MVRRGGERRGLAAGAGWAPSYSLGFLPGVVTKGSAGVWHICSCQLLCNYEPRISVHRITSVSFAHTVVGDRGWPAFASASRPDSAELDWTYAGDLGARVCRPHWPGTPFLWQEHESERGTGGPPGPRLQQG